jgi:hypothetical protein
MATSETRSAEPNASSVATIEQDPPVDAVMADSGNAAIYTTSDVDTRDSDEVTPDDEPASDVASDDVGDEASNYKVNDDSVGSASDQGNEDGNDCRPWPTNSTYEWEHEPFETYKLKVTQLCRDLGFGEPVVERMDGGGFNRIIGLKLPATSNPDLVLRIPRMLDESRAADLKAQVALTHHLSKYDFLHVPEIYGYDSTANNALEQMYVLQKKIPGISAGDVFYDLPLSEKLQITTIVAEMLIGLESIRFDKPGRPVGVSSLLPNFQGVPDFADCVEIAPFRYNPMNEMEPLDEQPLNDLLVSLFKLQKEKYPHVKTDEMFDRLTEISKEMQSAGLMRTTDSDNVIWHWDLSANNVMIQRLEAVAEEVVSRHGCQHSVEIKAEDTDAQGSRYSIQVQIEDSSSRSCSHNIEVAIEGSSGKKYRHAIKITNDAGIDQPIQAVIPQSKPTTGTIVSPQQQHSGKSTEGPWTITGVIDWDDALSVPLVLSRKPPSWLWFEEKDRDWSQNRDKPPERDLTEDELLIKAHFDQLMEKARPGYIEDTYHRGIWLRKLARFALEGFGSSCAYRRYSAFVEEWDKHYASLRG